MVEPFLFDTVDTAVGPLTIVVDRKGSVTELWLSDVSEKLTRNELYLRDSSAVAEGARQLVEYASGERREFDLPLAPHGSEFQHKVWDLLLEIPYGETRSYGQLAAVLGTPNGSRAVGRANATNPIGIIIPCHRVIGASGDLTGYGGGLPMKQKLLQLEGSLKRTLFDA
jgi:methylated-DNA-[protein]-cysteine S-methyltransferase